MGATSIIDRLDTARAGTPDTPVKSPSGLAGCENTALTPSIDLTPRALEVVRDCTCAVALEGGVDTERGFTFTVANLRKCGLLSVATLASAPDEHWPKDKKGQLLLPRRLMDMIGQRGAAFSKSDDATIDWPNGEVEANETCNET